MNNALINMIKAAEKKVRAWKKESEKDQKLSDKRDALLEKLSALKAQVEVVEWQLRKQRSIESEAFQAAQESIRLAQIESDKLNPGEPSEKLRDAFQQAVETLGADLDFES